MSAENDVWLIVKRGLYFRPDCMGYTGIRDNAGRYSHDFAKKYEGEGITIVRLADAPEFTAAAFNDLVIKHMQDQRDEARAKLASAKKALEFFVEGYDNQDVNHVDYRVNVYQVSTETLEEMDKP